ncbi:MAG: STAS domain-containing protein [Calditrichaeota bacterium]|nr:STAS domain-containing protein [Calditrichota bacterium]MCB0294335.1 STAS domain-containing protein [Calditrichota bacterium]MCB0302624.1 STAS domain-containing protein [Calditrichota bacterium]MCB0313347.1 STAS domain-containing protein [Calditrichota bacterium]MCB9088420.1 STAS domain-containing protein [Calditrichia bacterium]
MDFKLVQEDGLIRVNILGAVDNENAEELKQHFQELLKRNFDEAVFDLTYVPFITSSGIGKLLIFYKNIVAKGKKMRIKGINDNLLELFKSIKLDQLFPIEP